jgi:hypothetical protein
MKKNRLKSPLEFRLKNWHGEEWHTSKGRIIRDIVYAIDTGLITTIAFLAGVSVSLVVTRNILLAGIAHITSGTIAIFFGAYISTKAQRDFFENQIERERQEIEDLPQKETEEIRDVYGQSDQHCIDIRGFFSGRGYSSNISVLFCILGLSSTPHRCRRGGGLPLCPGGLENQDYQGSLASEWYRNRHIWWDFLRDWILTWPNHSSVGTLRLCLTISLIIE